VARDYQREIERFTREAERAVKNDGPAAGPEGRVLTERHLLGLTKFIARAREKRPTRKTKTQKSLTPEVWDLIAGVPDQEIAVAALTGVLNATATPRREADLAEFIDDEEEESTRDTGTARAAKEIIGREIERQVEGCWLQVGEPAMAARIERATAGSRKERRTIQNKILREEGVELVRWKRFERIQVGNWAFDCCLKALPGVIVEDEFRAPLISQEAWDDAANAATLKILDHPIWTPDLEPPTPWTSFRNEDGQPFLRHCRDGAQQTNLLGGINDLYDAVKRRAIIDLDEALRVPGQARHAQAWLSRKEIIDRKLFKRLVMTFLYGQKKGGHKKALVAALADRKYEFVVDEIKDQGKPTPIYRVERRPLKADDLPEGQLDYFVDLVREAIENQLPGAVIVMHFVREIAKVLARAGKPLKWDSLSGAGLQPGTQTRRAFRQALA
jgi:DNA-dependent RNA polymerase-like protein